MWAILRVLFYSIEVNVNKRLVNTKNITKYLANKYWIGILFLLIILLMNNNYIEQEGIFLLVGICLIMTLMQFISFSSLARINASTSSVMKQTRLLWMLIFGLVLGNAIGFFNIVGVLMCFLGGVLISYKEIKESDNNKNTLIGLFLSLLGPILGITLVFLLDFGFSNNYFSASVYTVFTIITIIVVFNMYLLISKNKSENITNTTQIFTKKEFMLLQFTGVLSILVSISKAFAIETLGVFVTEVISATTPIFVLAIALFYKKENLTLQRVVGVCITVFGVILYLVL